MGTIPMIHTLQRTGTFRWKIFKNHTSREFNDQKLLNKVAQINFFNK